MSKEDKREHMLWLISDWRASGKSKKQYCLEKGVSSSTFYYWFSRSQSILGYTEGFVEIDRAKPESGAVEIIYPNGVKLRIEPDVRLLSQLIRLY
ncbi:hypothetical protein Lbys_1385 [Leadbetterella byssophila DSM 17132]|uniref:IS66 family insertion sequence element accessory protein TnpB n=1 Tax=Leadbetterella byssophila (strain DSM 17132 / JCM 16389 / KACC 11308 / NBRC 106382 / 4M15) TaxID=649349 RepID=E4RW65_LEAB4|nr:hypothetical protein [Leadbetterella byssophila]ADQ17100.1 hypothetical protein Lbys_1385 [Leadbetterella byssophila DSM 17132]